jgi:hypothetical protein
MSTGETPSDRTQDEVFISLTNRKLRLAKKPYCGKVEKLGTLAQDSKEKNLARRPPH